MSKVECIIRVRERSKQLVAIVGMVRIY